MNEYQYDFIIAGSDFNLILIAGSAHADLTID